MRYINNVLLTYLPRFYRSRRQ